MAVVHRVWSPEENEATVAEYFAMLRLELAGISYNKSEHNERLRRLLPTRTKQAVEYKFQNISAVLINHDQPYVRGYLPAQNYQRSLETAVLEWLEGRNDLAEVMSSAPDITPPGAAWPPRFADILTDAPEPGRAAVPAAPPGPVRIDFVRRDAENRALGASGEEFVLELERRRLHDDERRPDLAKRVVWAAREEGDGLGYDIRSFERDGAPRLIEVKTTGFGKYFPFAVTRNELACSQRVPDQYRLYRVHEFGASPRLYLLPGPLDEACTLSPAVYRASVARER